MLRLYERPVVILYLLTLVQGFYKIQNGYKRPQLWTLADRKTRHSSLFSVRNVDEEDWLDRSEEEDVIVIGSSGLNTDNGGLSLFDALYRSDTLLNDDKHSLSRMTLREISESYFFSLAFMGDYIVQMGCQPPIDVDTKLSNILTGSQIYSLMEALNSLDAYESNGGYDCLTLSELAGELGISRERILKICDRERVNLPFGMESILHISIAEKIRQVFDLNEYVEDDASPAIDVYGEPIIDQDDENGGENLTGDNSFVLN